VRDEDGQPGAASVDGLLARVAHGDAEAFAGVYDQVADDGSPLADRCLASMPGPQREALLLAFSGFTRRQVADLAGVPAERLREGLPGAGQPPGIAGESAGGIAPQRARPGGRTGLPQMQGKEGHRA
jgi:hypothetical protein